MPAFEPRLTAHFQLLLAQSEELLCLHAETEGEALSPSLLGACVDMLTQIKDAHRRLVERTFGGCHSCRGQIDLRRLATVPTTLYCEPCQARHEQQQPLAVRRLTLPLTKGIIE
jgi:RNA polymerase-binding transcription factor DksA